MLVMIVIFRFLFDFIFLSVLNKIRIIMEKCKKNVENIENEELGQIHPTQSQKPVCLAQGKK